MDLFRTPMNKSTLSEEEFASLYREAYAALVLVAMSEVGSASAEDVVQEAAISASSRLAQFTPGTDFKAWLSTFVRNTGRNHRRKEQRHTRMKERYKATRERAEGDAGGGAPGLALASNEESGKELREAVDALPDTMRAALLMRVTLDSSYEQIGAMLGIPINTARSHVHRARGRLERALTQTKAGQADG